MSIAGKWRITEMDALDQEAFDLLGPAFFSFDGIRSGSFRFMRGFKEEIVAALERTRPSIGRRSVNLAIGRSCV